MARCRSSGWQRPSSQGDPHYARTRLLALENTFHGKLIPAAYIEAASAWRAGWAWACIWTGRAFNAAVASGRPLAELCAPFDTVSLCFSRGWARPWARCWSAVAP